jgi:hypothetical protein
VDNSCRGAWPSQGSACAAPRASSSPATVRARATIAARTVWPELLRPRLMPASRALQARPGNHLVDHLAAGEAGIRTGVDNKLLPLGRSHQSRFSPPARGVGDIGRRSRTWSSWPTSLHYATDLAAICTTAQGLIHTDGRLRTENKLLLSSRLSRKNTPAEVRIGRRTLPPSRSESDTKGLGGPGTGCKG